MRYDNDYFVTHEQIGLIKAITLSPMRHRYTTKQLFEPTRGATTDCGYC